MTSPPSKRRTGGRSAAVRSAVVATVLAMVAERGLDDVTIPAIAKVAGVHETSIYRRWGTVDNLLLDALLSSSREKIPVPDNGSLHADLTSFIATVADYARSAQGAALARSLAVVGDDSKYSNNRAAFWRGRLEESKPMIERGISRGELADSTNIQLLLEMLVATVHFRLFSLHLPLKASDAAEIATALIKGFSGSARSRGL
ncbi:TetR/AcrR family transcriptional regulator (plasmid) [Rhodococcoides fascians A21d2]|uniref:TetR/AcrR family transcriptional regulator n=1 Tax=Rhodococcoides fascians TaxID=1828 RepID=UPI0005655EF3|nr:TetR/AcrR family transcriptional regulator [Rhodococcus fascians]QII03646.1 TetR/AcrR family transcriptional regulator [Rhodococcus fascians A21d2]